MSRIQTFIVTIETPYKDGCGEVVHGYNCGDVRTALIKSLPRYESISVDERGDLEEVKGRSTRSGTER